VGLAGPDGAISAIVSGDVMQVLDLVAFVPQPCDELPLDRPGNLPCMTDQQDGTLVPAVNVGSCEGGLRDRAFVASWLGRTLSAPQFLHSAYGGPPTADAPGQEIAYLLIFAGADTQAPPLEISLDLDGRISSLWERCGAFREFLFDGRPVLAPPLRDP
jgi:hypothetical protein